MRPNNVFVIGLTGGVGSGKSLVLEYLKDKYNCLVIKADDIGNEVKLKGRECYDDIVSLLGEDILGPDKEIIKNKMADKIFSDEDLIEKVNAIIHPVVKKVISEQMDEDNGKHKFVVVEAALLIEAQYFDLFDEVWVIDADKEVRIKRLMESRGYSLEKCANIIANQNGLDYYCLQSDIFSNENPESDYYGIRVIQNNSSTEDLKDAIDEVMEDINGRLRQY